MREKGEGAEPPANESRRDADTKVRRGLQRQKYPFKPCSIRLETQTPAQTSSEKVEYDVMRKSMPRVIPDHRKSGRDVGSYADVLTEPKRRNSDKQVPFMDRLKAIFHS